MADTTPGARNWTEDFSHENGEYVNRCTTCRETFVGHKRRVTCKVCAFPDPVAALNEHARRVEAGIPSLLSAGTARKAALLLSELSQVRADLAEARKDSRTVQSLAAMLGWVNVPPQHIFEAEIRALKARASSTLEERNA